MNKYDSDDDDITEITLTREIMLRNRKMLKIVGVAGLVMGGVYLILYI